MGERLHFFYYILIMEAWETQNWEEREAESGEGL